MKMKSKIKSKFVDFMRFAAAFGSAKPIKNQKSKIVSYLLTAAVMVFAVSCKDTHEDPPVLFVTPAVTDIVFAADGITILADGVEISPVFSISTNQSKWEVTSSNRDWLHVYEYRGNSFIVTAEPSLATPPSPAVITIVAGNAAPVRINVQQLGAE